MKTGRREFLKLSFLSSLGFLLFPGKSLFSAGKKSVVGGSKPYPDLIGIKNGSPAQMFDVGIKAIGGMKRFIKPGQTVLVKPNIGWNKTPSEGANTNPDLVGKIIELAYKAGAKKVSVFDNTCNIMEESYKNSGIEAAVKKNKGYMYPSDKEKYYRKASIKGAKKLKEVMVHNLYMDSDIIINVPVLKSHGGATMTAAIKNHMGVIWDRKFWHRNDLHQCIAEFPLLRKPTLNVIDAYMVMVKNGPRGFSTDDLVLKKMQIISPDIVLADAAAAKILKLTTDDVKYIKIADSLKYGSMNLKKANIKRISIKS